MDQPVRLEGNFTANPRRYAAEGKPHYFAKLAVPGTDMTFRAGLYSNEYDYTNKSDGSIQKLKVLGGSADLISPKMSRQEQSDAIAAQADTSKTVFYGKNNKPLRPGQVVLFEKAEEHKKPKDGKVKFNAKGEPTKPSDYYGYWNHNGQLIEVGGWNHQDKEGYFFIGGKTQFPLEREAAPGIEPSDTPDFSMSAEDLAQMERDIAEMDARGEGRTGEDTDIVPFGQEPKSGKGRRGGR
ncbi:hypothetical protein [Hyphomicrobium sp. DY-1]|uniref:hypothetical protein n=1 Tax=Hyphomicrobium sp. DY-1 TaxID=3075650 RepID=UPI0039C12B06